LKRRTVKDPNAALCVLEKAGLAFTCRAAHSLPYYALEDRGHLDGKARKMLAVPDSR
jgi:hypothetical protein